jgi:hypothetical protein
MAIKSVLALISWVPYCKQKTVCCSPTQGAKVTTATIVVLTLAPW